MEITRLLALCSAMAYIRSAPTLAMLLVGWVMFLFLTRGGGGGGGGGVTGQSSRNRMLERKTQYTVELWSSVDITDSAYN